MDLQTFLDSELKRVRANKLKETNQMTLGVLIDKLEAVPLVYGSDNEPKTVRYDFEFCIPTTLDSWRGSYDELALGWDYQGYAPGDAPDHNGTEELTLDGLLNELKSAIGKGFCGWKGGDYVMSRDTPIWVANPGNSGNTTITEVVDNGYEVILMTAYCEFSTHNRLVK
jgi:hypothetical protein